MTDVEAYATVLDATAEDSEDHGEHERAKILRVLAAALRAGTQAFRVIPRHEESYPSDVWIYKKMPMQFHTIPVLVIELPERPQP